MSSEIRAAAEVIDYVEEHLCGPLSLASVARALHVSGYHLHHLFTSAAGIPLHGYVLRRRLTDAAARLALSDAPILEIALNAGYDSQRAFAARFKAMYKLTPGQFRRRGVFYPLLERYALGEPGALSPVRRARETDIPSLLALARAAVDGFPSFSVEDFLPRLHEAIAAGEAWLVMDGPVAAGGMILKASGGIDFLAVHPQYRVPGTCETRGVCETCDVWQMLLRAALDLRPGIILSTTTFRAGDPADTLWRAALLRLGFAQERNLIEFGYPTQRMVLTRERAGELAYDR